MTLSLIHCSSKVTAFFLIQGIGGRTKKLLTLFLSYETSFNLEPLSPLLFLYGCIIVLLFDIDLIAILDPAVLLADSLIWPCSFGQSLKRREIRFSRYTRQYSIMPWRKTSYKTSSVTESQQSSASHLKTSCACSDPLRYIHEFDLTCPI